MVLSVASFVLFADSARADVFNMTAAQTSLLFVPVGDPGNLADTAMMGDHTTGYGSVPYEYQMGKYDVTVGQYCQFLNAVAKTDTYGLYNSGMAGNLPTIGITQSGNSGVYNYSITSSYSEAANCPIFAVTWGNAARFCNWLQNGQPTSGVEDASTTETGAYSLNGAITNAALMAVTRNAGATYFIPSENEWYKAAYYKGGSTNAGYWAYSTQSDTVPSNVLCSSGTNNANYFDEWGTGNGSWSNAPNYLTPVGAFSASPGPYGTFDMGGDVFQWNEASITGSSRGLRGGAWSCNFLYLPSSYRGHYDADSLPWNETFSTGFRVASVPEPSSIVLAVAGVLCLVAYGWRRRLAV